MVQISSKNILKHVYYRDNILLTEKPRYIFHYLLLVLIGQIMGFQFGIEHVFPETIISYYVISTYFPYEICSFIFKMLKTFAQSLTGDIQYRSSRSQIFFKVGVLTNSVIFTGKHLGWNLFLTNL